MTVGAFLCETPTPPDQASLVLSVFYPMVFRVTTCDNHFLNLHLVESICLPHSGELLRAREDRRQEAARGQRTNGLALVGFDSTGVRLRRTGVLCRLKLVDDKQNHQKDTTSSKKALKKGEKNGSLMQKTGNTKQTTDKKEQ